MAYQLYLGDMLFPVTPSNLRLKISGQNKTMNLINGGEINILNPAGLTDVSFDALLPWMNYPFAEYEDGFESPEYFLEEIESIKLRGKPIRLICVRESPRGNALFDTNMLVSLEDYQITEDAKDGFDVMVSISLKQYITYETQILQLQEKKEEEEAEGNVEAARPAQDAPKVDTYKVVKGDCLWNIAKKLYGNGSLYTKIYSANKDKISNPNLIYPGQILTIP